MSAGTATSDFQIGDELPDGTIFVGISPDTGEAMCTTHEDVRVHRRFLHDRLTHTFNQARKAAAGLEACGHNDWQIPTAGELEVMYRFADRIGGFDEGHSEGNSFYGSPKYWSSSFGRYNNGVLGRTFYDGSQYNYDTRDHLSLRCVRKVDGAFEPLNIGDKMHDGTVFAGIDRYTGKSMFATSVDATGKYSLDTAQSYAKNLDAHGHKDWKVPDVAQLSILFNNQAAIGGFAASSHAAAYLSSATDFYHGYYAETRYFGRGDIMGGSPRDCVGANLRCIRIAKADHGDRQMENEVRIGDRIANVASRTIGSIGAFFDGPGHDSPG